LKLLSDQLLVKKKPVIGIAGTLDVAPASSAFKAIKRDFTNEAYTTSLIAAGATPILLPSVVMTTGIAGGLRTAL